MLDSIRQMCYNVLMQDKFKLTPEENLFLAKKTLVESIYRAAKIEGVNTTFPETQTIIDGINVPSARLDDINTVLNLRDAYRLMLSDRSRNRSDALYHVCSALLGRQQADGDYRGECATDSAWRGDSFRARGQNQSI